MKMTPANLRAPTKILKAIAHPERLRLLNALRSGEECVCHLTALSRQRQAYVSQQLMFLRRAGLIADRKDGLRVYYRIKDARVLELIDMVNALTDVRDVLPQKQTIAACPCPRCTKSMTKCHSEARGSRRRI